MINGTIVSIENPAETTSLQTGQKNVTTAGTAVVLGSLTGIREVLVQSKMTNSGYIFVGPSTVANNHTNGMCLTKGEVAHFYCTTLADIYINSTVNGEGVTYLCW